MISNPESGSRQILAELELLLTQPTEPTQRQMEAAHGRATEAIRSVNERLANVHQLIAKGRRAEAIEIAEGPPHVLDEIAILDSQLVRDWEHWSAQFALPRFPPLRTDLASLVNSAYTTEHQLEHLLRRHRLLAISRGNMRQRVAVLNQLAQADASHPYWNKTLAQYQEQRLEQLAARATMARKFKDLRCLQQIVSELRNTRWLRPAPKSQVKAIEQHVHQLRKRDATFEAIALYDHILDAYAAGDLTRLAPMMRRWREIEPLVDESKCLEEYQRVCTVADWYDQNLQQQRDQEARSQALQRIGSIKAGAAAGDIHHVMRQIAESGAEVPVELHETYAETVRRETRAKRLKAGVITGAIACLLLAITSFVALAYRRYQTEASLLRMLDAVEKGLAAGELEAVDEMLAVAPRDDERFHAFRGELREKQFAEKVRREEFQQDVAELTSKFDAAKELDEFSQLSGRVSDLSERAITSQEQQALRDLDAHGRQCQANRRQETIDRARSLNNEIRQQLTSLQPNREARAQLARWNQQLQTQLNNDWIREQADVRRELGETSIAIADRGDQIREMARFEKSVSQITESIGNWDRWETLGRDASNADAALREKLMAVAQCAREERELWDAVETWNEIASAWKIGQVFSASPDLARDLKLDSERVQRAGLDDLPAAADFIAACQVALPTATRVPRSLEFILAQLQSPQMSELGAIKIASSQSDHDRWYYFDPDKKSLSQQGDLLRITHFLDLATEKSKTTMQPLTSIKVPADFSASRQDYISGTRPALAPHVSLCQQTLQLLRDAEKDPDKWDQAFISSYRQFVSAEQLDPLVQLFLARRLLDVGSQGSWLMATAYQEHSTIIDDADIETDVNWIDPEDEAAASAREQARVLLEKLRGTKPSDPRTKLAEMESSLVVDTQYKPIGWLDQSEGRWIVRTGDDLPASGPLFVRYRKSGNTTMSPVGRLGGGQAVLNSSAAAAMRIGRPVWLGSSGEQSSETGSR